MKWKQVKRDWQAVSEQIKLKWGKLSEDDLALIAGDRESFVRLYKQRYGDNQTEAEQKIDAFILGLMLPPEQISALAWTQHRWKDLRNLTHVRRGI